jgi:putative ABC transport system permease protein
MVAPRWRKVIKDLWGNKVRTLLVVLSIAIGVFAIGVILATRIILREDLTTRYLATNPINAVLSTSGFDDEMVTIVRRMDGVREAEARNNATLRVQVSADEWKVMNVTALADYNDNRISKITPVAGEWPPPEETLLVERASLELLNAQMGDNLTVEQADGKLREMETAGIVHDFNREPAQFTGRPVAYVTRDTLEWLGFDRGMNQMLIQVEGDALTKEQVELVAQTVQDKLEKSGVTVFSTFIPTPGRHPAQDVIDPLLLILAVLGALSLFASCFLVVNTINGLMSQQTQQIGIMKAVGARRRQITQMYLTAIVLLGLIALVLAIPLGGLAAYEFTSFIASLINFDLVGFRIPLSAVLVMAAVGILVPLLAALFPVFNGSRITVREALSSYGSGKAQFGGNIIDRGVSWLTGTVLRLSRPVQISLRNAIRRKSRLLLTLITLILGGSIFIGILSVHASLLATLDEALAYFAYDVDVGFHRPYRIEELEREALQVPGVMAAESWVGGAVSRVRANESEGPILSILGITADTSFIEAELLKGRWLEADDSNAIVINTEVVEEEPDLGVGDTVRLKIDGRESEWEVVGLVEGVLSGPLIYANRDTLSRTLRQVGQASGVQVRAEAHDPAAQLKTARLLEEHFKAAGFQVSQTSTIGQLREGIEYQFNLLVIFLAVMAVLIATVGGLGLMGTMSINVLERTREIGVMRAVGASDSSVLRIVLVEGVFVGAISWILAAAAGYPIGKILSDMVGVAFMDNPLTYVFATTGAVGWLLIVLLIAALSSLLPAWRASRLSVRQTLAYE